MLTMRKESDFSEWYNEVIEGAGLSDKRYPIKGMNVWLPYGWTLMKLIGSHLRAEFDATNHQETLFPLLIPEAEFKKEAEHMKGFEPDVYWVTHGGLSELDIRLVLRPTSETAMYPMFALWVRSHADLPLKVYQITSVFRYETKQTRTFMRVREIQFFEAHTCHATFEDAEQQVKQDLEINERLMRAFCIPYIVSKRPDWDKFPGAVYSLAADTFLPSGRALQVATFHQYGDNFAKVYDIRYEDEKGEHRFVHQTTDGMSERLLAAIISLHGDDKGLVLPPSVAPYQVVIVPIPQKDKQDMVAREAKKLHEDLRGRLRTYLDERDIRPGNKFYFWEARGVPLRVELGPRDIERGEVTVVRRDTGERRLFPRQGIADTLTAELELVQVDLYANAEKKFLEKIVEVKKLEDMKEVINRMGWCGKVECGHTIEEKTGMSILGTPYYPENFSGECVVCGERAKQYVHVARTH